MIEVPFGGGGQGALEADEEGGLFGFVEFAEAFEGGVLDGFVPGEAGEGAAFAVGDFVDGVFGEVVAEAAGVVELESALEKHLVEDGLFGGGVERQERGGFPESALLEFAFSNPKGGQLLLELRDFLFHFA